MNYNIILVFVYSLSAIPYSLSAGPGPVSIPSATISGFTMRMRWPFRNATSPPRKSKQTLPARGIGRAI